MNGGTTRADDSSLRGIFGGIGASRGACLGVGAKKPKAGLSRPELPHAAGAAGFKAPGLLAPGAAAGGGRLAPAAAFSFVAAAGPPAKKKKKNKKAASNCLLAAPKAIAVPSLSASHYQVLQLIRSKQLPAAVAAFERDASQAHTARGELLFALLKAGQVPQATRAIRAAKQVSPLPHACLAASLLVLPQITSVADGEAFLKALAGASLWASQEHESYFCHMASATAMEFLSEAAGVLQGGGLQRFGSGLRVAPKPGQKPGELNCGEVSFPGSSEARGFLPSDAVGLRPVEGPGDIGMCECEVIISRPLILRALNPQHEAFQLVSRGCTFRIDKLGNRTGYSRMMAALHCLLEPDRQAGEDKVPRRLPASNRPSLAIRRILVDPVAHKEGGADTAPDEDVAGLNPSQLQAVGAAMKRTVSLVQGPPGTGKTASCVQILKTWARTWKRPNKRSCLMATSDSNIAVDNLLEGLVRAGVSAVRLGHPDKAHPGLLEHTADAKAAQALGVQSLRDVDDRGKARAAVQRVIEGADVVCCTSVGAGAGLLADYIFPRVLVDEASQATEPATLVPICRGAQRLVLVGDHCQLPPTVTSDAAARAGLTRSLFERLMSGGLASVLLSTQYRMHPSISAFPSAHFYAGRIADGIDGQARPLLDGFAWPNPKFPVCLLAVNGMERSDGTSFTNEAEACAAVQAARQLIGGGLAPASLGIVAPYAAQVRLIRRKLQAAGVSTGGNGSGVEVSSVDGFQGREKDAIVMSTVRASASGGLGFVADWRRINVAFTRARRGLIVACQPWTLARDPRSWLPWLHWVKGNLCDGGQLPSLPDLDPAAASVGVAELERAASLSQPSFAPASKRAHDRSPTPEWKRPKPAAVEAKGLAAAGPTAALASETAAQRTDLLPSAPVARQKRRREADEEEEDDDRHESSGAPEARRGRRDVGTGAASLGSLGYGQRGRSSAGPAAPKDSPSPFLGGARIDMAAAAAKLGMREMMPVPPVVKAVAKATKAKVAKAKTKDKAATSNGGVFGLGAYASSASESGSEEGDSDGGDVELEAPAVGSAAALGGQDGAEHGDGSEESEDSSASGEESDDIDVLDEFLR